MPFEEAAAVPTAAVIALQGLRNKGQIRPGQKVLINGAGGGVGTFAVQIAKTFGAEVTGVDSAPKLDMVRSLGADHVIDYTQEDLAKSAERFDVILDVAAYRSVLAYKRVLSQNGVYILVGGSVTAILQTIVLWLWTSKFGSKKIVLLAARTSRDDLASVRELLEAGEVVPVVDRRYPLSECAAALRHLEGGHARGKVVIAVEHEGRT